jgi:hypothetical protein
MQAALRSIIATALHLAWAWLRGLALFGRDGTAAAGIAAPVLFAAQFVFIYAGLAHKRLAHVGVHLSRAVAYRAARPIRGSVTSAVWSLRFYGR